MGEKLKQTEDVKAQKKQFKEDQLLNMLKAAKKAETDQATKSILR